MDGLFGPEDIFMKGERESYELSLRIFDACKETGIMKEKSNILDGYSLMKAFIKVACATGKLITKDAPQEVKEALVDVLQEEVSLNLSE